MRKEIIKIIKKTAICDVGGIGDFHDSDRANTLYCCLKNPEEIADKILKHIFKIDMRVTKKVGKKVKLTK